MSDTFFCKAFAPNSFTYRTFNFRSRMKIKSCADSASSRYCSSLCFRASSMMRCSAISCVSCLLTVSSCLARCLTFSSRLFSLSSTFMILPTIVLRPLKASAKDLSSTVEQSMGGGKSPLEIRAKISMKRASSFFTRRSYSSAAENNMINCPMI